MNSATRIWNSPLSSEESYCRDERQRLRGRLSPSPHDVAVKPGIASVRAALTPATAPARPARMAKSLARSSVIFTWAASIFYTLLIGRPIVNNVVACPGRPRLYTCNVTKQRPVTGHGVDYRTVSSKIPPTRPAVSRTASAQDSMSYQRSDKPCCMPQPWAGGFFRDEPDVKLR